LTSSVRYATARRTLDAAVDTGELQLTGNGKKGDPHRYKPAGSHQDTRAQPATSTVASAPREPTLADKLDPNPEPIRALFNGTWEPIPPPPEEEEDWEGAPAYITSPPELRGPLGDGRWQADRVAQDSATTPHPLVVAESSEA